MTSFLWCGVLGIITDVMRSRGRQTVSVFAAAVAVLGLLVSSCGAGFRVVPPAPDKTGEAGSGAAGLAGQSGTDGAAGTSATPTGAGGDTPPPASDIGLRSP
jgi:hypothetical protein